MFKVTPRFSFAVVLSIAILGSAGRARASAPAWIPSEGVGNVHMPISCSSVQQEFDRGLALLHSFWYDRALAVFDDVIAADPKCQIAYWGAAMTYNHPLWAPPTADDITKAEGYIKRGNGAGERNDREAALFHAVMTLFGDGNPRTKDTRDTAYMSEMEQNYTKYPDDETALFYALSIEGSPGFRNDTEKIEHAGSLTQMVHTHQPKHPGALHYTIHAFDEPENEARALDAARAYAASAPAIPHALHMPSHTFLALGLWSESNATNLRAWKASSDSVKEAGQQPYQRDFHTLSFWEYGELQVGHYAKAKEIKEIALAEYRDVLSGYQTLGSEKADDTYDAPEIALTIAMYSEETGDYSDADIVTSDGLDGIWLAAEMQLHVLAALSRHDITTARRDELKVDDLVASFKAPDYSPNAIRYGAVAQEETDALYDIAAGDKKAGIDVLKRAADDESHLRAVYQPVMLPPANELLAQQLMADGQYAEAAQYFRAALKVTPNRPMAVLGLAKASEHLHDKATATAMMAKFSKMWSSADKSVMATVQH